MAQLGWVNFTESGNQINEEAHFTLLPIPTSSWSYLLAELTCKVEGMFMWSIVPDFWSKEQMESWYERGEVWSGTKAYYDFAMCMRARKKYTGRDSKKKLIEQKLTIESRLKTAMQRTYGNFPLTTCSWMCMGEILRGFRMQELETKQLLKLQLQFIFIWATWYTYFNPWKDLLAGRQRCRGTSKAHRIVLLSRYKLTPTLETSYITEITVN